MKQPFSFKLPLLRWFLSMLVLAGGTSAFLRESIVRSRIKTSSIVSAPRGFSSGWESAAKRGSRLSAKKKTSKESNEESNRWPLFPGPVPAPSAEVRPTFRVETGLSVSSGLAASGTPSSIRSDNIDEDALLMGRSSYLEKLSQSPNTLMSLASDTAPSQVYPSTKTQSGGVPPCPTLPISAADVDEEKIQEEMEQLKDTVSELSNTLSTFSSKLAEQPPLPPPVVGSDAERMEREISSSLLDKVLESQKGITNQLQSSMSQISNTLYTEQEKLLKTINRNNEEGNQKLAALMERVRGLQKDTDRTERRVGEAESRMMQFETEIAAQGQRQDELMTTVGEAKKKAEVAAAAASQAAATASAALEAANGLKIMVDDTLDTQEANLDAMERVKALESKVLAQEARLQAATMADPESRLAALEDKLTKQAQQLEQQRQQILFTTSAKPVKEEEDPRLIALEKQLRDQQEQLRKAIAAAQQLQLQQQEQSKPPTPDPRLSFIESQLKVQQDALQAATSAANNPDPRLVALEAQMKEQQEEFQQAVRNMMSGERTSEQTIEGPKREKKDSQSWLPWGQAWNLQKKPAPKTTAQSASAPTQTAEEEFKATTAYESEKDDDEMWDGDLKNPLGNEHLGEAGIPDVPEFRSVGGSWNGARPEARNADVTSDQDRWNPQGSNPDAVKQKPYGYRPGTQAPKVSVDQDRWDPMGSNPDVVKRPLVPPPNDGRGPVFADQDRWDPAKSNPDVVKRPLVPPPSNGRGMAGASADQDRWDSATPNPDVVKRPLVPSPSNGRASHEVFSDQDRWDSITPNPDVVKRPLVPPPSNGRGSHEVFSDQDRWDSVTPNPDVLKRPLVPPPTNGRGSHEVYSDQDRWDPVKSNPDVVRRNLVPPPRSGRGTPRVSSDQDKWDPDKSNPDAAKQARAGVWQKGNRTANQQMPHNGISPDQMKRKPETEAQRDRGEMPVSPVNTQPNSSNSKLPTEFHGVPADQTHWNSHPEIDPPRSSVTSSSSRRKRENAVTWDLEYKGMQSDQTNWENGPNRVPRETEDFRRAPSPHAAQPAAVSSSMKQEGSGSSGQSKIMSAYLSWCKDYNRVPNDDRFQQFGQNYEKMESLARQTGKALILNAFADYTENEFADLAIQKSKEEKRSAVRARSPGEEKPL